MKERDAKEKNSARRALNEKAEKLWNSGFLNR
jgi:hypothetical protein